MSEQIKIGVFGHYGNQNLGDEAIITAVIQNIRTRMPEAEICCFSINPEDTQRRHRLNAYPIRNIKLSSSDNIQQGSVISTEDHIKGEQSSEEINEPASLKHNLKEAIKAIPILSSVLRSVLASVQILREIGPEISFLRRSGKILKNVDLLMISGSNQFLDNFGGTWGFPYTLLKWTALAKLNGTKIAYVSVGAGPLELPLSKFFIKHALNLSDYCSFRDPGSRSLIETTKAKNIGEVIPDLAHSLIHEKKSVDIILQDNKKMIVGINPMPVYDERYWPEADAQKYQQFVNNFANFSNEIIKQGHPVFFFATQPKDEGVIRDILDVLKKDNATNDRSIPVLKSCQQVGDLLDVMESADIIVATRFHGVLLSLFLSTPVVAVCYGSKTHELMVDMGQGDYSVNLENLHIDDMIRKFTVLVTNRVKEIEKINEKEMAYKKLLEEQYSNIFKLVSR